MSNSTQILEPQIEKRAKQDPFQYHDYYQIDDLLTDEHKLIRESVRSWIKKEVSPIIEEYAQQAKFPRHLVKELGEIGAFGSNLPVKYVRAKLSSDVSNLQIWLRRTTPKIPPQTRNRRMAR